MDLRSPCSLCTSIHRKPAFYRQSPSPNATNYPFGQSKCRRKTTSELRTPVEAASRADSSYSPPVPSHKVTVHDRQRGVVHEFLVPEGYALLCVGFPSSDVEVETQDEDEDRDDYALELAMADE
ncbi:hypothetical protein RJ639_042918 [Escallonia herrerae]|uniref:Ferredoxin n=1 Tax=Escallonia herrerae TaxID=1293975 RepID=A0AA88WBP3_9ASTE|nr:hypothetical protein RJ639_042918 [Escallonia herrerae]